MKIDRRQFTGALIATLCFGKGWANPSELPACPSGFSWYRSSALEAFVPRPDEWFVHEKCYNEQAKIVYVTREHYSSSNQFFTGFAVNVLTKMEGDISSWCKALVTICLQGMTPVWQSEQFNDDFYTYGIEKIDPPKGYRPKDMRIRIVGVGNKKTNAVYLVQFEAPADTWESEWKIGQQIYEMFKINESV